MNAATAAEYAAGLRQLADLIDANPDLPAPQYLKQINAWYASTASEVRAIGFAAARAKLPVKKVYHDKWDGFELEITCGPIVAQALAARSTVCERVLVGTETETVDEPDPDAPLVMIPDPTVTRPVHREVEKYEWRCGPVVPTDADAEVRPEAEVPW